ncbi:MAG: methyl-accepting chemotaxis protein [Vibrio sp.]|uniref:methyl-accepting chemotaxis protein n=1 Tax=Vibrio sp. TaxID=678 RepID=UPI003A8A2D26
MKKLLRLFPLYLVVSVLAGVPILIALALAISNILDLNKRVTIAEHDQESVQLILLYDNLAHNLALERGLTAGVLGSKGQGAQVEALKKQRTQSDAQIQALQNFAATNIAKAFADKIKTDINTQLQSLAEVRKQVDALQPKISPFAYYSNLNQLSIDNARILLSTIDDANVSELGSSLISVVIMKERAGQVRGALNGAFASQKSNSAQYTSINDYISSGSYAERSLLLTIPAQFLQQLNNAKNSTIWKNVEQIQQNYLSQINQLDNLQGPKPTEWFAAATERIGLLNQLRNSIQSQMISASVLQSERAKTNETIIITFSAVIGFILIFGLYSSVHTLRARVGSLTQQLALMSRDSDLSISLASEGRDEISQISQSLNGLTTSIRNLLANVTNANDHSSQRLKHLIQSSKDLTQSSQATTAKCENIAAAMTELSQSSVEIAQASERALDETNTMTSRVIACQTQSQSSFKAVEALVEQIEQTQVCMQNLEKDAMSVSKIVDTISGISEQTNLLALNAAIEAARAGEHGRGFAVVSSEVRDLAQRSKEATEHISQLLSNMSNNTNTAVSFMEKSRQATHTTFESVSAVNTSVAELENVIEEVNTHITSIANSTIEQSKASEDVDKDVDVLAEIAQNTGALADELNKIVGSYNQEAETVKQALNEFKLS